jgi:hypothetical protein
VSISISASVPGARAGTLGTEIASPGERRTDDACAAQDAATEALSQGLARHQSPTLEAEGPMERLASEPGPLDRFTKTQ